MSQTKSTKRPLKLVDVVKRRGLNTEAINTEKQKLLRTQKLYALRQLRSLSKRTQTEIALALGVTQNRISKLERYELEKLELRTITSYIEALGGKLTIEVELSGETLKFPVPGKN